MKKMLGIVMPVICLGLMLAGCGNTSTTPESTDQNGFDSSKNISVISREDGSGTRGAFVELMGVEEKDADGNKIDRTTDEASITNSTSVMITTVSGNPYAIGYISLGSLNDTVKALQVDGMEATVENIKSGSYKVSRPFNIATKGDVGEAAEDFISFIMSSDGQAVIEKNGYISVSAGTAFASNNASGKVVLAGSSSVTPVMEKLKEAYAKINTNVEIEIQQSDSSTGMTSTIDGICDIGMASRELKDSEKEAGLAEKVIAMDGIAVIVNNENTLSGLTSEQIKNIFTGEMAKWSELSE